MLRFDDPAFMWELYRSAVRRRERALDDWEDTLERYGGPSYAGEDCGPGSEIENPEFETVAQLAPDIVWDNPRVQVKTARPGAAQAVAKALHRGANRNIQTTGMRRTAQRVLVSSLLRYGVFFEELVDQTGYGHVQPAPEAPMGTEPFLPKRPCTRAISIRRYFQDPTATCPEEIRFRGHEEIAFVDDLLERALTHPEEGWNVDLLRRLAASDETDVEDVYRPQAKGETPPRGEISYVVMYVDGATIEGGPGPDQGFSGVWVTLYSTGANDNGKGQADELRAPYPAFGPKGGPYTLAGEYTMVDDEIPFAGIQAGSAALAERSAHQSALSKSAARRKSIALVDTADQATALAIEDAEDGDVVGVPGLDKNKVEALEVGGVTDQALAYKAYLDQKTDRVLGADDASVGNVTGKATATENAIASNATSTRTSGRKRAFQDALADALRVKLWFLYYSDRVAFPIPSEAAQISGPPPGSQPSADGLSITPPEEWFYGGNVTPGSGFTFEDLELEIEPYSMTRTSPEVQAALSMYLGGPFLQEIGMLAQNPAVDPAKWLQARADAMNFPGIIEIVDVRMLRLLQGFGLMAQLTPQQPQDPRLSGDIGANRTMPMAPTGAGGMGSPHAQGRLGGQPGAFGSKPQRTGADRIGMAPAGPAGRASKNKPAPRAGTGR